MRGGEEVINGRRTVWRTASECSSGVLFPAIVYDEALLEDKVTEFAAKDRPNVVRRLALGERVGQILEIRNTSVEVANNEEIVKRVGGYVVTH